VRVFVNREHRRIFDPKRQVVRENGMIEITHLLFCVKYYWSRDSSVCIVTLVTVV
jgi:hypothetical protein